LSAFEASLAENTRTHIELTMWRARRIVTGRNWVNLADFEPEIVLSYLRTLRTTENLGPRTYNHYVQAIDEFLNWCAANKRLTANPLLGLERLNPDVDIRHRRRALSPEELSRLVGMTRISGKHVQRHSPEQRVRIYTFSHLTGLRKKEMASLSAASFSLDGIIPTVTVAAACSKHRREDVLPLHPMLASANPSSAKGFKSLPFITSH
jgi:site-specific recombinase XerD